MKRGVPLSVMVRWRLRGVVPALVWLLAGAVAIQLYGRHVQGLTIHGLAAEVGYNVSPAVSGKLLDLAVDLDQQVAAGQVIGRLEDQELSLSLSQAKLKLARLRADLERKREVWKDTQMLKEGGKLADLRRFASDAENARIAWLEAKAEQAEDEIVLQGLDLRLGRTKGLSEAQVATVGRLDDDRTRRDAVFKRIQSRKSVVAGLEAKYHEAQKRQAAAERVWMRTNPNTELVVQPFEDAIAVQEMRIEKVNYAIKGLVVKAPNAGTVAEILRRPGETVAAGEPIIRLIEPRAREVVGWVPERQLLEFQPGNKVELRRRAQGTVTLARIASRGSRVEALPMRLTRGVPVFGRPIRVLIPDEIHAVPGEAFDIVWIAPR